MYTFTITVLLGLALVKLLDVVEELAPGLSRARGVATIALAVAGAFAIDYSLFDSLGVRPRESWMGPLFTGLVVAGTTAVWAALLHWLRPAGGSEPFAPTQPTDMMTKAA